MKIRLDDQRFHASELTNVLVDIGSSFVRDTHIYGFFERTVIPVAQRTLNRTFLFTDRDPETPQLFIDGALELAFAFEPVILRER